MDLFESIFSEGITIQTYLLSALIAIVCGAAVALVGSFRWGGSKSFFITLTVLPFAVQTVIIMVNGSIGTGIAVAGAFSLVRFRSVAGRARDILSIFIVMTAGLACATGYIAVALIFTAVCCLVMLALGAIRLSEDRSMELKITVPENLNFTGAFDDVFEKYTRSARLVSVKNANMGSLYKLSYIIEMKNESDMRDLIDDLRVRNGNLEITIFKTEDNERL